MNGYISAVSCYKCDTPTPVFIEYTMTFKDRNKCIWCNATIGDYYLQNEPDYGPGCKDFLSSAPHVNPVLKAFNYNGQIDSELNR